MDVLLHAAPSAGSHSPRRPRRLSTVGHGDALRDFAAAARGARIRFMVIGGTYRDAFIRSGSTRDIDVVLADRMELPADRMRDAGFTAQRGSRHAWERHVGGHRVILEVAAIASTKESTGPFSVAYREARVATIDGVRVRVPRLEDYVILKLIAAAADPRRAPRDLLDVRDALTSTDGKQLSVAMLRARMRDTYSIRDLQLKILVASLRTALRGLHPA